MTHTLEPISGLTAFEEALTMLHIIMTTRSATNEERTKAAEVMIDALLTYGTEMPASMATLIIKVVR